MGDAVRVKLACFTQASPQTADFAFIELWMQTQKRAESCNRCQQFGIQTDDRSVPGESLARNASHMHQWRELQVLEHVRDLRSLDMHTLLATLVGAIQQLAQQNDKLATRVENTATM